MKPHLATIATIVFAATFVMWFLGCAGGGQNVTTWQTMPDTVRTDPDTVTSAPPDASISAVTVAAGQSIVTQLTNQQKVIDDLRIQLDATLLRIDKLSVQISTAITGVSITSNTSTAMQAVNALTLILALGLSHRREMKRLGEKPFCAKDGR